MAGIIESGSPGGKSNTRLRPLVGLDHLVRLFEGLFRGRTREPPVMVEGVWINGLPGYVSAERDGAVQTTALQIVVGQIASIFTTRNPKTPAQAIARAAS